MSYIKVRGSWHNIILNVHVPTDYKDDFSTDTFYEEKERVLHQL